MSPLSVLSPEHVAIELRGAGLGRRFAAALLDLVVAGTLAGGAAQLAGLLPGALAALVAPTAAFACFWGYHVLCELRGDGRTLGKRLLRLRVVDARGLPVGPAQSMVRNVVRVLDLVPAGGLGMLCALLDPAHRRLGDLAAGTLVVEDALAPDLALAGSHARRVNSLDQPAIRTAVRHRVGLEEREFLVSLCLRAETLDPGVRYDLFEAVGADLRNRLGVEGDGLSGENVVRGVVALFAARVS
jgi:uncharacterized RDD family membrane protein YckC